MKPLYTEVYVRRASAWDALNDYGDAIAGYTWAMELGIHDADIYDSRGQAFANKKEWSQAITDYDKAIELNPTKPAELHNRRGAAWSWKDDYDKAIADYTQAVEIDPKFALAYQNRGLAWYAKKDYDKAIADHSRAIEIDAEYADAYKARGDCYEKKGDIQKAYDDTLHALTLDPKNSATQDNLVRLKNALKGGKG